MVAADWPTRSPRGSAPRSPSSPARTPTPLPLGRRVELPGRGTTFVREVPGPPGAPTVVLLHGLVASGWAELVPVLRAPRPPRPGAGHRPPRPRSRPAHPSAVPPGRLRRRRRCAPRGARASTGPSPSATRWAGRSPSCCGGGTRSKVSGLVLCATAGRFVPGRREQMVMVTAMSMAASSTRAGQLLTRCARAASSAASWPTPGSAHPARHPAGAGPGPRCAGTTGAWSPRRPRPSAPTTPSRWIREVDVPTAVVVTTDDKAVPPDRAGPPRPPDPPGHPPPGPRRPPGVHQPEVRRRPGRRRPRRHQPHRLTERPGRRI